MASKAAAALISVAALAGALAGCSDGGSSSSGNGKGEARTVALPAAISYVALGDSIASGYGLDAVAGSGSAQARCARSSGATPDTSAYTDLVRAELIRRFVGGVSGTKLACSGDTSQQMNDRQISQANREIGDKAAVVTITIGANDFAFTDPASYTEALSPDDEVYLDWVRPIAEGVRRNLAHSLMGLGRDRPLRRLIVTHYYDPFNARSVVYALASTCSRPGVTDIGATRTTTKLIDCRNRTAEVVGRLNRAIDGAAADYSRDAGKGGAPVTVVNGVSEAFTGHEGPRPNCGDAAPDAADAWVQTPARSLVDELLLGGDSLSTGKDCFHPNAEGHRQLATLVIAKLPQPGS